MNATNLYGETQANAARALIGADVLADNRNDLYRQILVALANRTGGGGGTWGSITGTLSSQTDLVAALASKSGLWQQVDVAGTYNTNLTDLGRSVFTDINAGDAPAQVILPPMEAAMSNGGTIRISAQREFNSDNNFISVYAYGGEESGGVFRLGTQSMYSLYSTGVGGFLELQSTNIDGTLFWQVLNPSGYWEDRD